MILCDLEKIEGGWQCKREGCRWVHHSEEEPIVRCLTDPGNPFSPHYKKPARGFGDTVANAIKAVGLAPKKPCEGCQKRQAWLNNLLPYDTTAPAKS